MDASDKPTSTLVDSECRRDESLHYVAFGRGHTRYTASCCFLIWRRRRSAHCKDSSPALPTGYGSMACAAAAERIGAVANRLHAPDEFRLDRADGKGHITFGKGTHFCVAAALARLQAMVVLRRLLDRTTAIDVNDVGRWLPSLLVRRLERVELTVGIAG